MSWRYGLGENGNVHGRVFHHHHHHHLSLNARVVWAPQMIRQPVSSILRCSPLGPAELQACPFPEVVFLPLPLSASSSSPFHCALQDGFGQTWWTGGMSIPLQCAFLYGGQEVFVWSDCLLDLGTDFLVCKMYGLCMRCVVSCGSTSFPWLVFFFGALLKRPFLTNWTKINRPKNGCEWGFFAAVFFCWYRWDLWCLLAWGSL